MPAGYRVQDDFISHVVKASDGLQSFSSSGVVSCESPCPSIVTIVCHHEGAPAESGKRINSTRSNCFFYIPKSTDRPLTAHRGEQSLNRRRDQASELFHSRVMSSPNSRILQQELVSGLLRTEHAFVAKFGLRYNIEYVHARFGHVRYAGISVVLFV